MMTGLHIRELRESELGYLYDALRNSAIENSIGHRFSQDIEVLRNALFQEKHSSTLVVEKGGHLVACLLYSTTNRNFTLHNGPGLYIHGFYVDKPHRRQKIGTQLVQQLVTIAKENNYGRVEFALLKSNTAGERFLESLSFAEIDFVKPMRLTLS